MKIILDNVNDINYIRDNDVGRNEPEPETKEGKMKANEFSIENVAGGDQKIFRMVDGEMSAAAIDHIEQLASRPVFDGPAADEARQAYIENF